MVRLIGNPVLNMEEVLALYQAVGWTNYTQEPEMLQEALEKSLFVCGAYVEETLVGLVRVVGDGVSIVFLQDLLVLPAYQRQGIGRLLVEEVLAQYGGVYQLHLLTDQTDKTAAFYRSLGFKEVSEVACRSFTYVKEEKDGRID